jgi:Na+/melibiose symporter-like transporter
MAKKIRKRNRKGIVDLLLGWNMLSLAVGILVIAAFILLFGLAESEDILHGFLAEIVLFGAVLLIAMSVAWLIRRRKRPEEATEGDSE